MNPENSRRNLSIDFFKALSIFAVILCHTHPFADFDTHVRTTMESLVNQLTRFAVPFFYIVFGFFVGKKLNSNINPINFLIEKAKYFLKVYALWCLIYIVITFDFLNIIQHGYAALAYWKIYAIFQHPFEALFNGTKAHLWFLPSLVTSFFCVILIYVWNKKHLLPITFFLYILGVLGGAYHHTSIGIDLPFDTRNGPLFGSLFIALGMTLAKKEKIQFPKIFLISFFCLGIIGQFSEVYFLNTTYKLDPTTIDFVFSTAIFGLSVALIAFSMKISKPSWFTELGKYTLSINLIHELFVELLKPIGLWTTSYIYAATVPLMVLFFSLTTILIFYRFPKIRPLLGMN